MAERHQLKVCTASEPIPGSEPNDKPRGSAGKEGLGVGAWGGGDGAHGRVHPAARTVRRGRKKQQKQTDGELMSYSSFVLRSAAPKNDLANWQAARVV